MSKSGFFLKTLSITGALLVFASVSLYAASQVDSVDNRWLPVPDKLPTPREIKEVLDQYEEFAEFLGRYIESEKKFNNFAQAVEEYFTDTYIMAPKDSELVLDILRTVMGDDEDWISYWMYELDCGREWKPYMVTKNGEDIPLRTMEDLWNLLNKEEER